jgi:hypothetical protein
LRSEHRGVIERHDSGNASYPRAAGFRRRH